VTGRGPSSSVAALSWDGKDATTSRSRLVWAEYRPNAETAVDYRQPRGTPVSRGLCSSLPLRSAVLTRNNGSPRENIEAGNLEKKLDPGLAPTSPCPSNFHSFTFAFSTNSWISVVKYRCLSSAGLTRW
jgi:hypothetical protein